MYNNNQPNINIPEQPPINSIPPSPKNKIIIAIIIFAVVAVAISLLAYKKQSPVSTNLINQPSVENKIYSVKEINDLFQDNSEILKIKPVQLKAYVVDGVRGIGCHDYSILTDYDYVEIFKNRYDSKLTAAQQKEAQELAKQAPVIYTGMTLSMPKEIFPTQAGIYEGHFYDSELQKMCDDGEKRFVIEKKIQELTGKSVDNQDFKVWNDRTGYVKGAVIDHVSGCEVDGACKLIVQAGDEKVALVYAEGDIQCLNTQAASWVNWGKNVNKGTVVKAYGAYKKLGNEQRLTFCDSKDYFILGADDPVPVGAYTEKFFDEVEKRKAQVTTYNSPSQSAEDVWKVYKNSEYNFEFSYPQNWIFKDLIANPNQSNDSYDIAVGYTSPGQNAVRGITYCEAYNNQTPRCEVYKGFIIDWEYGGAMINDAVGGTVGISLKKTDVESKDIFRKILSTFKFIK